MAATLFIYLQHTTAKYAMGTTLFPSPPIRDRAIFLESLPDHFFNFFYEKYMINFTNSFVVAWKHMLKYSNRPFLQGFPS
jgi:hypothetical protein